MVAKKKTSILCQVCNHNMGRSRCRVIDGKYGVRCNKCKTVYDITIKLPEHIHDIIEKLPATHSQATESQAHAEADQGREGVG